jgi:Transposase DDE domain/Transposase domain (DUF772)
MLGRRSPQRGPFEADPRYADFVGRDTFSGWLASQRGALFPDELFAAFSADGWGRPSVPPSLLATALVLQTSAGVSDEEAAARAADDLRWQVALGIAVDRKPFAKRTLQAFRARLLVQQEQRLLFQHSLDAAKRRGKLGRHRTLELALDTTPILGRGAVKDTDNLLADGLVAVPRVLAAQAGVARGDRAGFVAWATAAGDGRSVGEASVQGGAAIDWDDAAARVRVARGALVAGSAEDAALADAAGLLSRALGQDIERREAGTALRQGTAPERLVAIHDPEMRHGRTSASTRCDGHKGALAVDSEQQLITAVDVLAGKAPDAEEALALVEQSEQATDSAVEETAGDGADGDGETRQAFADAGRVLHAKVPVLPNHGGFPKTAFRIDLGATPGPSCTCPGGHTTTTLAPCGRGRRACVCPAATCAACPLRAQCLTEPNRRTGAGPPRRARRGRTILRHPQEPLLQQARTSRASPAFAAVRRRRQVVEQRIARLVQLGIRQARYVGRAKTLFQLAMAAAVANLPLLAGQDLAAAGDADPFAPHAAALVAVLVGLLVAMWAVWAVWPPARWRPRPAPSRPAVARCYPAGALLTTFRPRF